jgi:RNA polymerase sigma-70 factor (ECF subfamily)
MEPPQEPAPPVGGSPDDSVAALLQRWHAGDRAALDALLARHLPWLRGYVKSRLGPALRARGETIDFVQEVVVDLLQYAPRFVVEDADRFRGMLARIVENNLRDADDWYAAKRRALSRETALPADSVLQLDPAARSVTRPSEHAERAESRNWLLLALEFLEPDDRKVILLRQWEERSFAEIGQLLGIGESGARMRFQRALPKLARAVEDLAGGAVPGGEVAGA